MSDLSQAELEAQIDTDLSDGALTDILAAVNRQIVDYAGPTTNQIATYDDTELGNVIRLPLEASSIDSVVEFTGSRSEPTKTTLAADDYELSTDGWEVRRLSDGTNARGTWGWRLVVQFDPNHDADQRRQVAIKLARIEITHTGYSDEGVGDWRATQRELRRERNAILSELDLTLAD